jgi:hypothetical protein
MSALLSKADIRVTHLMVCFGPIGDIAISATMSGGFATASRITLAPWVMREGDFADHIAIRTNTSERDENGGS